MVQHNGGALIDGNITNYLIRRKSKETENTVHDNDIEEDETVDTSDLNNLYQIETETDSETDEETTDKDTQSNVLEWFAEDDYVVKINLTKHSGENVWRYTKINNFGIIVTIEDALNLCQSYTINAACRNMLGCSHYEIGLNKHIG